MIPESTPAARRTSGRNRRAVGGLVVLLWHGLGSPASGQFSSEWPIVELRQYTLHPGGRDVLIELFESEFVESQEAVGMKIVGTFRDLDRPDRFVWIRAFRDMASRAEALTRFYSGPVWRAHGKAAARTMVDATNALLLRDARPRSGLSTSGTRPPPGARAEPRALIVANICSFEGAVDAEFVDFFDKTAIPQLKAADIAVLGTHISETAPNNYPQLPVRPDRVFVWFTRFADRADYNSRMGGLRSSSGWSEVETSLRRACTAGLETLHLQPTPRSLLGA